MKKRRHGAAATYQERRLGITTREERRLDPNLLVSDLGTFGVPIEVRDKLPPGVVFYQVVDAHHGYAAAEKELLRLGFGAARSWHYQALGQPQSFHDAEGNLVIRWLRLFKRGSKRGELVTWRENPDEELEKCLFCGQPAFVSILEYWPEDRAFMLDTCCEGQHEWWVRDMQEWTPEEWQQFFAAHAGASVRSVGGRPELREKLGVWPEDVFTVDQGITLVRSMSIRERLAGRAPPGSLSRDEIREYVRRYHAHAGDPPAGFLWGYAVFNGPASDPVYDGKPRFSSKAAGVRPLNLVRWPRTLIGVAMIGRPSARLREAKGEKVAEVSRVAFDRSLPSFLTYKASSSVYDQAFADACDLGYDVAQTFTLGEESGMSLRYARWKPVGESKGGQADRPSRRRKRREGPLVGRKIRWERRCPKGGLP